MVLLLMMMGSDRRVDGHAALDHAERDDAACIAFPFNFHGSSLDLRRTQTDRLHAGDCRMVELDDESIRFHSI